MSTVSLIVEESHNSDAYCTPLHLQVWLAAHAAVHGQTAVGHWEGHGVPCGPDK